MDDLTLRGYWPLTETSGSTAYDYSGRGLDGTVYGASMGASGLFGSGAYSFDGNDDYVKIDSHVISAGKDSLSVSAWIYITGNAGNSWERYVDVQDGNNGGACALYWDDDDARYGFSALNTQAIVTGANPPSGEWMLWTGVLRNGSIEFYMNAEKKAEASTSNTTSDSFVSIGKRYDANDQVLAKMNDVRVYSHALSLQEIQYLYSVGSRGLHVSGKRTL
ncbi:LamG domain-containing protein [Candidatus Nanosalina sp. VS9-1]|uniref:LamG domain-containing protein n=1 Tax=Candidatus Nanosalina sp. VS9-1 TaxID=3388566 RepID=UPI0039DFB400